MAELDQYTVELLALLHDIRSPLNAVIGFADMLKSEPHNSEQTAQFASYIVESGYRVNDKVTEMINKIKEKHGLSK